MKNTVKVLESKIEVSANPRCEDGIFVNHEVTAILPGCRKAQKLSISPNANSITVRPLFGYNGEASIAPSAWQMLVESSPVVSSPLFPIAITPEIIAKAKQEAASICTCPAVTDLSEVSPRYLDAQTWDRMEFRY